MERAHGASGAATDPPDLRAERRGRGASDAGTGRPADPRVELLRELADPVRLRVVDRLAHGPATPSELASPLGVASSQLSNHLRRLREAGLVRARRSGRHLVYELADPGLEALMTVLDRVTGRTAGPPTRPDSPFTAARTCYQHLAGGLGVRLYRALLERAALHDRADGNVELGPRAREVFAGLGVDAAGLGGERRRFAYECFDATEHAPHLGGAVGDAVCAALAEREWIEREPGTRVVRVTSAGAHGLRTALGVE